MRALCANTVDMASALNNTRSDIWFLIINLDLTFKSLKESISPVISTLIRLTGQIHNIQSHLENLIPDFSRFSEHVECERIMSLLATL
jgi:hypothetical protein